MKFELFVATRYLRAKRRQAVIGVITGISILGVAAGVASLIIALAINNGFRQDLQDRLLGSTSHVNLLRIQSDGIKDWQPLMDRLSKEPHVVAAAPAIYEQVLISRGPRARGAVLKGMIPAAERKVSDLLKTVTLGSADALNEDRVAPDLPPGAGGSETRLYTGVAGFEARALEDRWILSRFNRVAQQVHESLDAYRFDNAATSIYDFFWGEFCDWYIELTKPRLAEGADEEAARIACRNLVVLFEASLRLLHPVMPFITEEIWQAIYDGKPPLKSIALACYPTADQHQVNLQAETDMAILQDLIVSVRNLRAELKVEQKLRVPIQVYAEDGTVRALIEQNTGAVERLANVQHIEFAQGSLAKLAGARHTARFDVHVVYAKPIDAAAERARLQKELERIEKEIANGQRQLSNEQFLAKAPADVVEGLRRRAKEVEVLRGKTKSKLDELQ